MKRHKQQGMILPVMMLLLTMLIVISGRLFSLSEQNRHAVRESGLRSRLNSTFFSAEEIVLQMLPTVNIPVYQHLQGKKVSDPLVITLSYSSGQVEAILTSAQKCINLAPLSESDSQQKMLTWLLLKRMVKNLIPNGSAFLDKVQQNPAHIIVPAMLQRWVCNLPGAGQFWDMTQLTTEDYPLLALLLPGVKTEQLKKMLSKGLSSADREAIGKTFGNDLLLAQSNYYWLDMNITEGGGHLHVHDLVRVNEKRGLLIRRRLLDDNAL